MTLTATSPAVEQTSEVGRISMIAFGSIILLLYNPMVSLAAPLKFGAVMLILATLAVRAQPVRLDHVPDIRVILYSCLLVITAIRSHRAYDANGNDISGTIEIQYLLSACAPVLAGIIYWRFGRDRFFYALTFGAVGTSLLIAARTGFVPLAWGDSGVGDIQFDSYQQVGLVFGAAVVLLVGEVLLNPKLGANLKVAAIPVLLVLVLYVAGNRARGEMVALIAALALMLTRRAPALFALAAAAIPGLLRAVVLSVPLPSFQRLARAYTETSDGGQFGLRDQLFTEAMGVGFGDVETLAVGRGGNYFQAVREMPFGSYPHNVGLEALISMGVAGVAVLAALFYWPVGVGVWRRFTGGDVDRSALGVCVLVLIIANKSGTISSAWWLGLLAPVFLSLVVSTRRQVGA